eukprot:403369851
MESSQFYCLNCSSPYNLTSHIPINLECGDEICLDCYQNKLVLKQDGTYTCCFDSEHEIEKREKPIQNRKIINKLKSMDVLRLVCEKHKEFYSEYYCTQCDQIVCYMCSQLDHLSHNGGKLHKVNPENFKEYLNFINPLLDKQLEMITNLKSKLNNHISQAQILSSSDFIQMLNNAKLLLKDFVKQEDLSKLSITHYKLQGQPQEEIKQQIEVQVNKQQAEFQVIGRQKIQKYENPSDQDKISAEYYNYCTKEKEMDFRLQSSINYVIIRDPLLLLFQVNLEKHLVDTQVFHGLLLVFTKKIDKLFCFSQIKDPYIQLRITLTKQFTIIQVV